jgi:hypothetical protein
MRGGAGTGPGRECAALMRDLRVGDSFDMAGKRVRKARNGQWANLGADVFSEEQSSIYSQRCKVADYKVCVMDQSVMYKVVRATMTRSPRRVVPRQFRPHRRYFNHRLSPFILSLCPPSTRAQRRPQRDCSLSSSNTEYGPTLADRRSHMPQQDHVVPASSHDTQVGNPFRLPRKILSVISGFSQPFSDTRQNQIRAMSIIDLV